MDNQKTMRVLQLIVINKSNYHQLTIEGFCLFHWLHLVYTVLCWTHRDTNRST